MSQWICLQKRHWPLYFGAPLKSLVWGWFAELRRLMLHSERGLIILLLWTFLRILLYSCVNILSKSRHVVIPITSSFLVYCFIHFWLNCGSLSFSRGHSLILCRSRTAIRIFTLCRSALDIKIQFSTCNISMTSSLTFDYKLRVSTV